PPPAARPTRAASWPFLLRGPGGHDQRVDRALVHLRGRAGFGRMAHVAVLDVPRHLAVVACAAELAIDHLDHIDLVAAGLELEAQVGMADLAAIADAVEPVRKDHRPHA